MNKYGKLTLLLFLALLVMSFTTIPSSAALNGNLVKEHKYKASYYRKGKWTNLGIKYHLEKYKYDKHYNKNAIIHEYCKSKSKKLSKSPSTKYKLTYKKGKLEKRLYKNEDGYVITEFRNGVPIRYKYSGLDDSGTGERTFKARYLESDKYIYTDYDDYGTLYTRTLQYDIQMKDGYPIKITSDNGPYSDKSIVTFYTTESRKGLVKKIVVKKYDYDEGYFEYCCSEYKYSYKIKKGLVSSYTLKSVSTYNDGHVQKSKQTGTFKYTKKKVSGKRYRSMINDIIDESNEIFTYW